MRALCIGDLHLGAGADLGREPGERLAEQSAVLTRAVEIANELDADLFWMGDAWERRRPTPVELDAFQRPISRLERTLIVCPGNHDVEAAGRITGYDVALFGRPGLIANEPSILTVGDTGERGLVDVAVLPWAPRSTFVAREGGGDVDEVNRQIAEKLLEVARGLYARCDREHRQATILLAHWSVGGSTTDSGMPADLFREPVLDAAALSAIGFDAIILGHIHRPQRVADAPSAGIAPIYYVGSPMPLNFGEATGEERGAVLLDVGEKVTVTRIPIESRRLVTLSTDLTAPGTTGLAYLDVGYAEAEQPVRDAIVKVKIRATEEQARRIPVPTIRQALDSAGAHKVWAIQVEVERAETVKGPRIDETVDDGQALDLWLDNFLDGSARDRVPVLEAHDDYMEEAAR